MGSPAIEISLEPAAPKTTETPDEPPGPLTDAAAAAAPSVASSEATENNQPKITRTEAEDAEFSRRETPDKPVEKSPAPQAKPLVSNEFRRLGADGPAEIRGSATVGEACRAGFRLRRGRPGGEAHLAKGVNGASQSRQTLSCWRSAFNRGQRLLHPRQARSRRQLQRETFIWPSGFRRSGARDDEARRPRSRPTAGHCGRRAIVRDPGAVSRRPSVTLRLRGTNGYGTRFPAASMPCDVLRRRYVKTSTPNLRAMDRQKDK